MKWWGMVMLACAGCDGGPSACTPGMSIACACSDGRTGAQVCNADGTFGICMCEGFMFDAGRREDAGRDVDAGRDSDAGREVDAGRLDVDIVALDAGETTTCVAMRDGRAYCWGRGIGASPTAISGVASAIDVGPGTSHYCYVESAGDVGCWGDNSQDQLGHASDVPSSPTPVTALGLIDARTVTAGGQHTCALRASRAVSCWGLLYSGRQRSPTDMGITSALQVEAGDRHTCALLMGGSVACWGANAMYELGNGTTMGSASPVPVIGLADVRQISAARGMSCAVRNDGTVACWGNNSGLLQPGVGIDDAVEVANGNIHACARSSDGTVRCWGANPYGQLGDGTVTDSPTPVVVSGLSDAVMIAAGGYHTCAVRESGALVCWGGNEDGELGDGSTLGRRTPVVVALP